MARRLLGPPGFPVERYIAKLRHGGMDARNGAFRRAACRMDPVLWALVYMNHHLTMQTPGGPVVSLSEFHVALAESAKRWARDDLAPAEMRQAWIAPRSSGKPVDINALVLMGDGSRKRLGDIDVGDWVITHLGRARAVTAVHEQGMQPSVRITTRRGRSVQAALDHPFLTDSGWVAAGDLTTDNRLVTVPSPDVVTGASRSPEEFRLAGYFTGDGGATWNVTFRTDRPYTDGTPRSNGVNSTVTCADHVQLADMRLVAEKLGFTLSGPHGKYSYYFGGGAKQWLRQVDVAGKNSHTKRVPDWVFTAPPQRIAEFLGAYLACDGTVPRNGRGIEYNSVSKELLLDVQHLLLRIGVRATLRPRRGNYLGKPHWSWRLRVENVAKFAAAILPHMYSEKNERLALATARGRFDDTDRVVSVERVGGVECRCITVDEDHTFTANDLVVRNSSWLFLVLPLWALAYRHREFVLALAHSGTQAREHLSTLRRELDNNELLRRDFPALCEPARTRAGGSVANRRDSYQSASGVTIAAKGMDETALGAKVGSTRPDLIVGDDLERDEGTYSMAQKEKRLATLRIGVLPMNDRAVICLSGTTTMFGSITHDLVRSAAGQAVEWVAEERFQCHHFRALMTDEFGNERSLWEAKWPLEYLRSISHQRSFAMNMQCEPVSIGGTHWTPEDFVYDDNGRLARHVIAKVLAIDPAVTSRKTSDQSGLAVVGYVGHVRKALIERATGVRLDPARLREKVHRTLLADPEIRHVIAEVTNGGEYIEQALNPLPNGLKLITTRPGESKLARITGLFDHYQRGRVVHARPFSALEAQMCAFPHNDHDDITDAVEAATSFLFDKYRVGA